MWGTTITAVAWRARKQHYKHCVCTLNQRKNENWSINIHYIWFWTFLSIKHLNRNGFRYVFAGIATVSYRLPIRHYLQSSDGLFSIYCVVGKSHKVCTANAFWNCLVCATVVSKCPAVFSVVSRLIIVATTTAVIRHIGSRMYQSVLILWI